MSADNTKAVLSILERIPVAVVIANPVTAEILWVNGRTAKMARVKNADEIIGKSLFDFIQPPQMSKALIDLAKVAIRQSPPDVTYQLRRDTGEYAAAQVGSIPMMFKGQLAMLSIVTDVSERERLVMELRESEERYRLLVESLPSGVWVVADDVIVFANDTLVQALGYRSDSAMVGIPAVNVIAPESVKEFKANRKRVLTSGHPVVETPVNLLCRDGVTVAAKATVNRVTWEGGLATQTLFSGIGVSPACVAPEPHIIEP